MTSQIRTQSTMLFYCRRCLAHRNPSESPPVCRAHSSTFVFSTSFPQRATFSACTRLERFYWFCPFGCRCLGNGFSLGPHIDAEHSRAPGWTKASNPATRRPHAIIHSREKTVLNQRLREIEHLIEFEVVPQMIEWFQTIQRLQQEMGRYHSVETKSENSSGAVLALNRQITELKKELKGVEAERDQNIVRAKMFEREIQSGGPLDATLTARLRELTEINAQRDRTISEQCLQLAGLNQQVNRLSLEIDSLRLTGGGVRRSSSVIGES